MPCKQVSYYLDDLCTAAISTFIASDVTGAFAGLPLNCTTMNGANDRAAGEQQEATGFTTATHSAYLHLHFERVGRVLDPAPFPRRPLHFCLGHQLHPIPWCLHATLLETDRHYMVCMGRS